MASLQDQGKFERCAGHGACASSWPISGKGKAGYALDSRPISLHFFTVSEPQGPYIIVTKSGHVFGATSVTPTENDLLVKLKGLEHRLQLEDISIAYEIDPQHPAVEIDPGILSTVTALDRLMVEFAHGNPPHLTTIFGSGSLALTLLPERSTNDLDTLATDKFADFVNSRSIKTDITVELLDEALLKLLGPWATRTSELIGPLGSQFRLVHPLDTVMQKLLRFSEAQFREKDQGDIQAVLQALQPTNETLIQLLTENPARYARLSGRFASQADAIERNTTWFLNTYLSKFSFADIMEKTGDRAIAPTISAGFLPGIPQVDFRSFLIRRPEMKR